MHKTQAFTIAELLIALAILGVIAVFTIPKILDSGGNAQKNAILKDVITQLDGAFTDYKMENTIQTTTTKGVITQYLNYIREYDDTAIDSNPSVGTYDCTSGTKYCYLLPNGAVLGFGNLAIGNTSSTSALTYVLDPNGKLDNDLGGVSLWYYPTGHITTFANILPNSYATGNPYAPNPTNDPSWVSWDGK